MADTHEVLRQVVHSVRCKPGWRFHLVNSDEDGLRLRITDTRCVDSYSPDPDNPVPMPLAHFFPVPKATYSEPSWVAWVFECCQKVEAHELGEWFRFAGERPFAPLHGPGEDPYRVHQHRPDLEVARLTTQDGSRREDT